MDPGFTGSENILALQSRLLRKMAGKIIRNQELSVLQRHRDTHVRWTVDTMPELRICFFPYLILSRTVGQPCIRLRHVADRRQRGTMPVLWHSSASHLGRSHTSRLTCTGRRTASVRPLLYTIALQIRSPAVHPYHGRTSLPAETRHLSIPAWPRGCTT